MPTTQFCFTAIDGSVPAAHAANSIVESKTPSGTTSATTAVADKDSTLCRVATDTAVYVSFGTAPNAGTDTIRFMIPAGGVEYFRVKTGDKAAVITV